MSLPADFRDQPKRQRWWINILVLLHLQPIKPVCCEKFRKQVKVSHAPHPDREMRLGVACKGCATLYSPESDRWLYRFLAKIGKKRKIPS